MLLTNTPSFLAVLPALFARAIARPAASAAADKPAAFFLAGDSTTAVQSSGGGGWGSGFLNTTLRDGAIGTNYGHNGATTVSFREGGDWDTVIAAVKDAVEEYTPYVTIQFGHNDQKTDKGISVDQYSANLAQFVADVRDAGGNPILVTPLSRRKYDSATPPQIKPDLAAQRTATLAVAEDTDALVVDLNEASMGYLNKLSEEEARTWDLKEGDQTHLNDKGSLVFGNMVAWLMGEASEELAAWVAPDAEMVRAFEEGTFIEG